LDAIETACGQDSGTNRVRSLSVTDAHVTAANVAVDSHRRYERDTNTGRDHSQSTAELATFEHDVWSNAGVGARSNT
jgi:hypothetical protein